MGRAIYFHATSTSHGIVKTCWAGLERWGGLWRHQVCFKFTHTKENKMEANGAFSQTLIFFNIILYSILGPDAYSAVRGQHIRAKNIKDAKNIF